MDLLRGLGPIIGHRNISSLMVVVFYAFGFWQHQSCAGLLRNMPHLLMPPVFHLMPPLFVLGAPYAKDLENFTWVRVQNTLLGIVRPHDDSTVLFRPLVKKINSSCKLQASGSSDQRVRLHKGHLSIPRICFLPWSHPHQKNLWMGQRHAKWQRAAGKLRCALAAFRSANHSAFALAGAFLEHKASACSSSRTCALSRQQLAYMCARVHVRTCAHGLRISCLAGDKRGTLMDYASSSEQELDGGWPESAEEHVTLVLLCKENVRRK